MGEASLNRRPRGLGSELNQVRNTLHNERMNPDAVERLMREPQERVIVAFPKPVAPEQFEDAFKAQIDASAEVEVFQRLHLQQLARFSRFPADVLRGFVADIHQNALCLGITPPPIDIEIKPKIHQYYEYKKGTKKTGAYYESIGPERYEEELERYYRDIDPFTTSDYD